MLSDIEKLKMPNKLESSIEKECLKLLKIFNINVFKMLKVRGLPDRLCILPNKSCFFIEFKQPNKKPTPLQTAVHKKLHCEVYIVSSEQQLLKILNEIT